YSDGTNGFAEGAPFYVFNSNRDNVFQPLVTLEYFIDKNDSVGKGTTITFTPNPADSIDLTVDIPLNSNLKQDSHTFFIRAINSGGIASADAKGRFVYGQLTAIENPSTNDLSYLKLYPNPAHDFITIESAKGDIEIVNITGQTLLKQHITSVGDIYKIDISNLANGLYFIKLIDGDNATTKKFIKR
ncbi:MAG: T9SS type A sorting domain-containing protein, partial [Bacteroidetes bacterium]|nr:T9SS type A sorting domain-containing protein [Bacteroidota bacterium]